MVYQPFFLCRKKLLEFFSLDFCLREFFFLLWAHLPHYFSMVHPLHVQSLILSGKNILQELPSHVSRELTTMRHVSFINNLDNLDTYLYSDRQSSNFLTIEIQSNLNLLRNGSYAAKSIECSNYKQGHTFSFIK